MTAAEFKAAHPEAYLLIQKEAIDSERDRVGALLAFQDLDSDLISKTIKEGGFLNQTMTAELTRKAIAKTAVANIEADSAEDLTPEAKEAGAEKVKETEKATADFMAASLEVAKGQLK